MKLFYVDRFVYELSNSLLPPRDPNPPEVSQYRAGMATRTGTEFVALFIRMGYTPFQSEHLYKAIFNHYWYDYGIRDVRNCNRLVNSWQQAYVAPAWRQVQDGSPAGLPPAAIYIIGVVAIIAIVVLLVAPEFEEIYRWSPPGDLYLGTYREQLWWMALVGVSRTGVPHYRATGFEGNVIMSQHYEYLLPPVATDVLGFWGSMDFRCWKVPWFRSYRLQTAETTFIGFLREVAPNLYVLKSGWEDAFAPPGPLTIPTAAWCRDYSPCHV